MTTDVAIIGGGPAGSTAGTLLKKYSPDTQVLILEREQFPRDHVGESQLPSVSYVLDEMDVWDKVESAGFPVKIGATYRWGKTPELWDFDFLGRPFAPEVRPAKFDGQRRFTAFQVDRAIYDEILLEHAGQLGCEVRQNARVVKVKVEGDRVTALELESGESIQAKHYIDASGHSGILRRAVGVEVEYPTSLQNIAIWDYWQNAEWAEEIGVGGTRVQVMSVGFGWIWFIPLGPTRTSIGLVTPAEYYKSSGMKPAELYEKALAQEERIAELIKNAASEGKLQTTRDWSFLAARQAGDNWILAGESSGFADPILAAGLNIAQAAAREAAFTILELLRGKSDPGWLRDAYEKRVNRRILNHIRFADYWYTANAQFTDLQEFTKKIAEENGLDLSPQSAWAWLAQGGFIDEDLSIGTAGFSLTAVKGLGKFLSDLQPDAALFKNNVFKLDLSDAKLVERAHYFEGRVLKESVYEKGEKVLPLADVFEVWFTILSRQSQLPMINREIMELSRQHAGNPMFKSHILNKLMGAMEALISDGWVQASYDARLPLLPKAPDVKSVHWHTGDIKTGTKSAGRA